MYQKGILDACSDPAVREIVIMAGAQVGKTEMLLNTIGYHIAHDPAPMLMVMPTAEMGQAFSKDRLAPMLRDTPILKDKVKDPRSRDANNTTMHKVFPGGHITIVGANSPSGLAARPCRIILLDECDRMPPSAGSEGDPIQLAKKRSNTFWNRKIILTSTPTNKGASRIETAFEDTDKRYFHVPCPHCGHSQRLVWRQVRWDAGKPETAQYYCEECGAAWTESEKHQAVRNGEWVATEPFAGVAGFHLNGIYSPWTPLADAAKEFLQAKKMSETLRVFINTYLAEVYEDEGDTVSEIMVRDVAIEPTPFLDERIQYLVCGVDTQDDRLECHTVGIMPNSCTTSVDYRIIYGDPSTPQIWNELDEYLHETWVTEDERELAIRCTAIDSGGHYTSSVYDFVRVREGRRIFAIKGMGGEGRAVLSRPTKNNIGRIKLFTLGVDNLKATIFSRLKITDDSPGRIYIPNNRSDEWFAQLCASEKIVTKFHKGFPKREFVKTRARNEALDTFVYALGASAILGLDAGRMAAKQSLPKKANNSKISTNRGSNYLTNW